MILPTRTANSSNRSLSSSAVMVTLQLLKDRLLVNNWKLLIVNCQLSMHFSCSRLVLRHRLQQPLDDVLDGDAFALGGEVEDEAMPQDRMGDGSDIVGGHVMPAIQVLVRLGR